jgi:two-component system alkaline phosphatase synthesis response regulator PhoP
MQKVLVVEDSKFLRTVSERALKNAGYHVIVAADGEEALRIARTGSPDAIILDMLLPKVSGPEVLRLLKKETSTAEIPVVVLTSLSKQNKDKLMKDGAFAFIEKGSLSDSPDALVSAVQRALTKKEACRSQGA